MIWSVIFLLGLGIVAYGFLKALRTRQPDQYMMGGGSIAAIGFIGFDTWPTAITGGMERLPFLSVVLTVGGGMAALWSLYQLGWSMRARTWPTTEGTLIRSEEVLLPYRNEAVRSSAMKLRHAWRLSYTYTVDGQSYTSDQRGLDTDEEELDLSAALKLVRQHPVGSTITVYRHPKDAALACVDRSAFNGRWLMPALFAVILLGVARML